MTDYVALLSHQPPFRFVDVVDAVVPGASVAARYRVTGEEAFLAGHFPGNPVFPGVIQLEALAQAGAVAVLTDERFAGRLPLFGGVEEVRFRRVVRPGDELVLEATVERLSARGGRCRARASVDGHTTCEGRLLFTLDDASRGEEFLSPRTSHCGRNSISRNVFPLSWVTRTLAPVVVCRSK